MSGAEFEAIVSFSQASVVMPPSEVWMVIEFAEGCSVQSSISFSPTVITRVPEEIRDDMTERAKLPLLDASTALYELLLPRKTETTTPVIMPEMVMRMKAMTRNSTSVRPFCFDLFFIGRCLIVGVYSRKLIVLRDSIFLRLYRFQHLDSCICLRTRRRVLSPLLH